MDSEILYNLYKIYSEEELILKINELINYIKEIDKIYLFGSYARNEANQDSDIDLFIILKDDIDYNSEEYFNLYKKIRKLLSNIIKYKAFDILMSNKDDYDNRKTENGNIEYIVNKEGILING